MPRNGLRFEFGEFRVDRISRQLLHRDRPVPLTNKCFELLVLLAQSQGDALSKELLIATLWPNTFVEEGNLTQNISSLRKALAIDPSAVNYIETVPRKGYRFTAPVSEVQPTDQEPDTKLRSVVVLPFLNLSGDTDNEYFSDGLTEEITNALTSVPGLRVVARTTAFQYKGQNVDVRTIGSKVGAAAVLEGSVRRQGERLRVTAQLISAGDGYHYWSRVWDKQLKDVFEVQREIANGVALELGPDRATVDSAPSPPTENMEAYNLYLRGLYLSNRLLIAEAADVFEQAVTKDPNFAAAHAALAYQYALLGYGAIRRPVEAYAIAGRYAGRAIELSPSLPSALFSRGWISTFYDWDWVGAERYLKLAIAGNQNTGGAHHAYAHFLVAMRRFAQALRESQQVLVEEPGSPTLNGHLAWHYLYTGQPQLAIPQALHALEIDPLLGENMRYLRWGYEAIGSFEDAIRAAARQHSVDFALRLRTAFESRGEEGYWQTWLDYCLAARRTDYSSPYEIATIAARLDRKQESVTWLQRAFDERDSWIVYINIDPKLKNVLRETGVQELISKLRLP
jgi:TolB-like protein